MKTLEKLEDEIMPIMLDAVKNNLTVEEACKRAGVSFAFVEQIMKQRDVEQKKSRQKTLSEIKEIATQLMCDMKNFKESNL